MALARAAARFATATAPRVAVPAQTRAVTTSRVARGANAEMFTPEKFNPLGAPRTFPASAQCAACMLYFRTASPTICCYYAVFIFMFVLPGGLAGTWFVGNTQFSRWTPSN